MPERLGKDKSNTYVDTESPDGLALVVQAV